MYKIIMLKAKWDRQIKVYVYISQNIARDIISETVLKIKICEKYKISGMLLIFWEKSVKTLRFYDSIQHECIW